MQIDYTDIGCWPAMIPDKEIVLSIVVKGPKK